MGLTRGDRGVTGERGPKGDHGQAGDRGKQGLPGQAAPRRALIGYLILAAAVVFSLYISGSNSRRIDRNRTAQFAQINGINRAQCASLRNLYRVIRKTIHDGDVRIDTLAYYRDHPDEAKLAHGQNAKTLRLFRTPPCPADVTVRE